MLARVRGVTFAGRFARQTTENFFRLFSKVPRVSGQRMTLTLHHSGLRLVGRRAARRASAGARAIRTTRRTGGGAARC